MSPVPAQPPNLRVLVSALSLVAWSSFVGAQQLPFESYNIDDGLAQSAVVAIAQTPEGSLWFGTQAGLSRFDGLEFTNLGVDDGLPGALVRSLEVGVDGRLWVGTEDGVAIVDPVSLAIESLPLLDDRAVRAIDASARPAILGTWQSGLLEFDGHHVRQLTTADGLPSDRVRVVQRSHQGQLWVGTWGEGVALRDIDGAFRRVPALLDGLPRLDAATRIRAIYEDPHRRLWIGADDGLWLVGPSGLSRLPAAATLDEVAITAILFDSKGRLWLATRDRGACRIDSEQTTLECLGVTQGLADNSVYALHEDHEGSIWLGTYGGGVSRLSTEGFFNFRGGEGLAHANVYAFAEDRAGDIWVGTNGGGASVWNGDTWRSFTTADGLSHDKVVSLLALDNGSIALGTLGGLCFTARGETFDCRDRSDGLPHEIVLALAELPVGRLWIGTHDGLTRLEQGRFTPWTEDLPDSRVNVLTPLRDGRLAVGTAAGMVLIDPRDDGFELDPRTAGLFITAIYEGDAGTLWLTSTDGLLRLAGPASTHWGVAEGLPHRLGSFVIGDGTGGVWVGTNRGLVWFDGAGFDPARPAETPLSVYTARDGLPSSEMNRNAALRDRRGRLWFGTVQGVAVVQKPGNPLPRRPPRTVVTRFATRDRQMPLDGTAQLEGGRPEALDIEYLGISLAAGGEVSYEIALEGFDPTWKHTRSRSVQYTALPPGRYVFKVRAGIPGSAPSEPDRLAFEIVPAWWQRRSIQAIGLAGSLALLLVWATSLTRRNRLLEARVRERTQELEDLNGELERLALHDRLTGLPNRHACSFVVARELADRRRRLGRGEAPTPLTVALVDLDRFKPLNDSFGHAFGDSVLIAVAQALSSAVREVDVVARWGGEEFLLLLRDAPPTKMPAVAERILEAVRTIPLPRPDGSALALTTSLGWCELPPLIELEDNRWEQILHLADLALYDAKAAGRDCGHGWSWREGVDAATLDQTLASRERPAPEVAERLVVGAEGTQGAAPAH